MDRFRKVFNLVMGTVVSVAVFGASTVHAQLTDIANQNLDGFLGVATSGSETGIHELGLLVPIGLGVAIIITLAFAGYHLVRRLVMRAQSA